MRFLKHLELEGRHARMSPSKYSWANYSEEKMERVVRTSMEAARGDRLHKLANDMIRERIRAQRSDRTFNAYVNDAIGFRMTPEVPLYYSDNCFGTADALSFDVKKMFLRVHDLKTGKTPTKVTQLEIYAALFCLEYRFNPLDLGMEFRIYQSDEVQVFEVDTEAIFHLMKKIEAFDKICDEVLEEVMS